MLCYVVLLSVWCYGVCVCVLCMLASVALGVFVCCWHMRVLLRSIVLTCSFGLCSVLFVMIILLLCVFVYDGCVALSRCVLRGVI